MRIIVADTGPLIALAKTKHLFILKKLFKKTIIPQAVFDELQLDSEREGVQNLRQAIQKEKWLEVYNGKIRPKTKILNVLDSGEVAAITLAEKLGEVLLIDERIGRSVAKSEQIDIIGTAGLLILAKRKKLINNVKDVISSMQNKGYRFSRKLIKLILNAADEK